MKPIYTQQEFNTAKSTDKLKLKCHNCSKHFFSKKSIIKLVLKKHIDKNGIKYSNSCKFCSRKCFYENHKKGETVECKTCKNEFYKTRAELKKYPNSFCSNSCSAIHMNKHKTHGNRRSKLEIWLENQLVILYPDLEIHYNRKDAINSELDFYFPNFKLGIELNGIFHYEPIFGEEKLSKIQNNDQRKFQACLENGIELVIIDASQLKYFKPKNAQKYLDIVCRLIDDKSI